MNKKEIKESFDRILPTEEQKEKMLNQILNHSKPKPKYLFYWAQTLVVGSFALFCIFFLTGGEPDSKEPVPMRMSISQIEYKGNCYEEVGLYTGDQLEKITDEIVIPGGELYLDKQQKDGLIVYMNGVYKQYELCKGERK